MVRLGLIGEDRSDREVLKWVLRKTLPATQLSFGEANARGIGEVLTRWERLVRLLPDADLIVLCVDRDGKDPADEPLLGFARDVTSGGHVPVLAVESVEGWLLGDEDAVRAVTGHRGFRAIPNTESVADPKRRLVQAVRSGRGRPDFNERRDNPKLAERMDLRLAASRNRSLASFVRAVQCCL